MTVCSWMVLSQLATRRRELSADHARAAMPSAGGWREVSPVQGVSCLMQEEGDVSVDVPLAIVNAREMDEREDEKGNAAC